MASNPRNSEPFKKLIKGTEFTDEQIAEFHAVFDHFDDDNDGLLSPVEVSYMMTTLGYPPKKILRELTVKLMKEGHSKKHARKHKVSFALFLSLLEQRIKRSDEEDRILDTFMTFDKDGDGKISASELCYVLMTLDQSSSQAEVEEMMSHIDKDGNGEVEYTELIEQVIGKRRSDDS